VSEKREGVISCSYKGKWKDELEKWLQTDERVTLLALGRNRYELLAYLRKREDIEIVKVETRYMKNRDKGIGIKVTVRKLSKSKPTSRPLGQRER
jgi:hypothetical protein